MSSPSDALTWARWRTRITAILAVPAHFVILGCTTPTTPQTGPETSLEAAPRVNGGDAVDKAGDESGDRQNYRFEIDAPEAFVNDLRSKTFVGRWQSRDDYNPVQFDGLVARLHDEARAILHAQGYFEAKVTVSAEADVVRLQVVPGARTKIDTVQLDIEGAALHDEPLIAQIKNGWPLKNGDGLSTAAWERGKQAMLAALKRAGYLRAVVRDSRIAVNRDQRRANLSVRIDSGSRMEFGELRVDGLERYDEEVVRNLRTFSPGDPYDQETLLEFETRLRGSGYFQEAGVVPDLEKLAANPGDIRVGLQVKVLERQSKRAGFGIGYSTDDGIRGQVGFEHRNLFDRNWQLESAVILAARQQRAFANVRTPLNSSNHFWGFGGRLEREDIEGQQALRSNVYFGRGRRVGNTESFLSIQDQNEELRLPANAERPEIRDSRHALVLGYSWTRRHLDSVVDPRNGYSLNAQLSGAHENAGSDTTFVRSYLRALRYVSFGSESALRDSTFVLVGEVGYIAADSRQGIPSENLFRTGGGQSIRGYRYQSLGVNEGGAIVGGRYLAIASLEYQHRMSDLYSLATFIDFGNAGDSKVDVDPVTGYGIGVRGRTPIGPINLDVAYGRAVEAWRVHFSVGYSF